MKPRRERRRGLVKDGSRRWMNMMAAFLARQGAARFHWIMLGDSAAFNAHNTKRPAVLSKPYKARFVIWKVALEVFNRILFHAEIRPFCLTTKGSLQHFLPTVKG